jgi:N6-L-threonylcarbamoyladenine synthase
MAKTPTILAIESSCDETSAAVVHQGKVLNNIIATQAVHKNYGGVVPELASRAHQSNIVPVVNTAMKDAGINLHQLDAIAFTRGPGLLGSLLVGTSFGKAMALSLNIPLIAVDHMEAHVLAHFINPPYPEFPFICLTVSGGHTQLVLVKDYLDMQVIGQTRDDAVGEAFDKIAKLLGFPYPGGPMIDQSAQQGDPLAFQFPSTNIPELDYSFSGIKTAVKYFLRDRLAGEPDFIKDRLSDICASVQHTLVQMLFQKLKIATKQYNISQVAIAGGVGANTGLRQEFLELAKLERWAVFIPEFQYCTDNAAMIAITGHYKYLDGQFSDLMVGPDPRQSLDLRSEI